MLSHIFTEDVEWYIVKVKSYPGMKDHSVCMHARNHHFTCVKKPHYHILHLLSAIPVIPVMLHAVFILNLFSLALSLKS